MSRHTSCLSGALCGLVNGPCGRRAAVILLLSAAMGGSAPAQPGWVFSKQKISAEEGRFRGNLEANDTFGAVAGNARVIRPPAGVSSGAPARSGRSRNLRSW